jgi:hypothetical protein
MGKKRDAELERQVDFAYHDKAYQPDLLSYKEMDIIMNRWASTGTGWMSVIVVFGLSLLCAAIVSIMVLVRMSQAGLQP